MANFRIVIIVLFMAVITIGCSKKEAPIAPPEKPTEPLSIILFDGKSFNGWTGKTSAWRVSDGVLHNESRGTIFTESEYGDFILKFDFKIEKGGNNGLLLRVNDDGVKEPTRKAMEVQIADDKNESHPYQTNGSLFEVYEATIKPTKIGEWNTMIVRYEGSNIKIEINGVSVVDMNLETINKPGYGNAKGRIGFMGWLGKTAFRDIEIQPLDKHKD